MTSSILLLRMGGVINLLIGILHIGFWSLFDWPDELAKLSIDNSNIVQMLNLLTIVFFFYTSFILMFMPGKLLINTAGRLFIGMFAVLYLARLAMEFYFPNGSIGFAIFMIVTISFFGFPLVKTKSLAKRINKEEHLKHPWRVHRLLPDLKIEDVWVLPVEMDADQNIGELSVAFSEAMEKTATTGIAGILFRFRFFLGKVFGWEDTAKATEALPVGSIRERYVNQEGLTNPEVNSKGFSDFVPVYEFEDEMLSEIENVTVLAAVHFGRVAKGNGKYGVQMTVYVKPKGLFGEAYMLLIKPFRLLIVYPVMLKLIGRQWEKFQMQNVSGEHQFH